LLALLLKFHLIYFDAECKSWGWLTGVHFQMSSGLTTLPAAEPIFASPKPVLQQQIHPRQKQNPVGKDCEIAFYLFIAL
jgi:hypothetical protein